MNAKDCCILNSGGGAWAFESLASDLSRAMWLDICGTPRKFCYVLSADDPTAIDPTASFIPHESMRLAADKRLLAKAFVACDVPIPETHLFDTLEQAREFTSNRSDVAWCIKYPTGCGGSGHRMLTDDLSLPPDWPTPLIVQSFIKLDDPAVFRMYAAGGELFGWVARRFPEGTNPSPWVAHARGARYVMPGAPPPEAIEAARSALIATNLIDSFGCADLMQTSTGAWRVLEVGTDGLFNHVDRDLGIPPLEQEIQRRIAVSFWSRVNLTPPWGCGAWRPRPSV